jgi:hypothetical protein
VKWPLAPAWLFRRNVNRKLDALLISNRAILQQMGDMMNVHDELKAELAKARGLVQQLIAVKTEDETKMQDVLTEAQGISADAQAALADNAADGGSTGGGSGSGGTVRS